VPDRSGPPSHRHALSSVLEAAMDGANRPTLLSAVRSSGPGEGGPGSGAEGHGTPEPASGSQVVRFPAPRPSTDDDPDAA
jgi:hypothetical protein